MNIVMVDKKSSASSKFGSSSKFIRIVILSSLMSVLYCTYSYSQQAVISAGGNIFSVGGSVSYSIGEVVFRYYVNEGVSIEQGVQHAYEIYTVSANEVTGRSSIIRLFPNPVADYLNLEVTTAINYKKLKWNLVDTNGILIESEAFEMQHTRIEMHRLPPAIYFLQVTDNSGINQTFKIIKSLAK